MARRSEAVGIPNWADTGDRVAPADLTPPIVETEGLPAAFSEVGGRTISREMWNYLWYRLTLFLRDIEERGILHWHQDVSYAHPAFVVLGTTGQFYRTKQNSRNVNPGTDADQSHWETLSQWIASAIAGNGLEVSGGQLRIDLDGSTLTLGEDGLKLASDQEVAVWARRNSPSGRAEVGAFAWVGTQAQYDALNPKDANTLYLIT